MDAFVVTYHLNVATCINMLCQSGRTMFSTRSIFPLIFDFNTIFMVITKYMVCSNRMRMKALAE